MTLPALPSEQSDMAVKARALLATAAIHEIFGKEDLISL